MPRQNLQDIIKKYNFQSVSTTPWQDPKASVLPYRGGGQYTVPSKALYTPTYKYPIKPPTPEPEPESEPEPVVVEESDDDDDDDDSDDSYDNGEGWFLISTSLDHADC
jgi:hypothetical protein